mgnify:CR=1 FL=1
MDNFTRISFLTWVLMFLFVGNTFSQDKGNLLLISDVDFSDPGAELTFYPIDSINSSGDKNSLIKPKYIDPIIIIIPLIFLAVASVFVGRYMKKKFGNLRSDMQYKFFKRWIRNHDENHNWWSVDCVDKPRILRVDHTAPIEPHWDWLKKEFYPASYEGLTEIRIT